MGVPLRNPRRSACEGSVLRGSQVPPRDTQPSPALSAGRRAQSPAASLCQLRESLAGPAPSQRFLTCWRSGRCRRILGLGGRSGLRRGRARRCRRLRWSPRWRAGHWPPQQRGQSFPSCAPARGRWHARERHPRDPSPGPALAWPPHRGARQRRSQPWLRSPPPLPPHTQPRRARRQPPPQLSAATGASARLLVEAGRGGSPPSGTCEPPSSEPAGTARRGFHRGEIRPSPT